MGLFVLRGRSSGGADQRRSRCDSGARDASRAGQRELRATGVVGAQRSQRCRARVQSGGAAAARVAPQRSAPRLLQPTRSARSGVRPPRSARRGRAQAGRRSGRRRPLPVRTRAVHERHHRGPGRRGVAADRIIAEVFGPAAAITPGVVAGQRQPPPSGRRFGVGPVDRVPAAATCRSRRIVVREPARARRGLRCASPMVVPDGRVSYLRDSAHQWRGRLPA